MKNTGKSSEVDFESYWTARGKAAHVERLVDAAEIKGRTGRIGMARAQPSDYIVTYKGETFYAEVKSTIEQKVMRPSLLKMGQRSKATMITAAGGKYLIFVHSIARDCWFCIPFQKFPIKSTPWKELESFKWI